MAEFVRIEKVSYLRIFTHNINKRKFMISCCVKSSSFILLSLLALFSSSSLTNDEFYCSLLLKIDTIIYLLRQAGHLFGPFNVYSI